MDTLGQEAARRRTFAIISHPDAGKTTLTEKLLLYGGAIHLAGSVKARKSSRHAVSDWMKMEQERGISITSSVLGFDHRGRRVNLLDTPGHADFSEDTYRTLSAVDSAVMLVDHAKGVEARTLKLFEVCRLRRLPILTFMNKLDREGLEPLALLDEITEKLGGLRCVPINWPIGMGKQFRGVVDRVTRQVTVYEPARHGQDILDTRTLPLAEAVDLLGAATVAQVREELELLDAVGEPWSVEDFFAGELTPVFWGSALSNFGVDAFLDFLVDKAPGPGPRQTAEDETVNPEDPTFNGFVFKIQANMNPRHRDRIAFIRVVSGRFERGMDVTIGRSGETLRLSKPHSFMAQERSIVEEAWPGDIVGLYDPGKLRIGDTISAEGQRAFAGIPRFAPEHFARVNLKDPLKRKQLAAGLTQLSHEGAIQLFYRPALGRQDPYLGAVGLLQFEVLKERLKNEYRVTAELEGLPFRLARWVGGDPEGLAWIKARRDYHLVEDRNGNPVVVAESPWPLQYAQRENPGLELYDVEPL
ncbi:MAG: peptide chain release factor 3 [Alphaproteobacteria bacterium]|nr:peptide chain release factor 3 [Alphaproteobacteria bacterium]